MSKNETPKSAGKTVPKGLKPFAPGPDPRRGRGPKKGAPNAGRPPDQVRALALAGVVAATPLMRRLATGESVKGTVTLPDGTTKDVDIRPNEKTSVSAYTALVQASGLNRLTVEDVPPGVQIVIVGGAALPKPK